MHKLTSITYLSTSWLKKRSTKMLKNIINVFQEIFKHVLPNDKAA